MTTIPQILAIGESLAVVAAAVIAARGLTAWRSEIQGRRRYELAEEVLALFYETKDRISYMRNPTGVEGEGSTRKRAEGEDPDVSQRLDLAYTAFERYQKSQEAFNRLRALRYRFMAIYGTEAAEPFDKIHQAATRVLLSSRALAHLWGTPSRRARNESEAIRINESVRKHEAVFWEGEEDDPITPLVDSAVEEMELTCKKILAA